MGKRYLLDLLEQAELLRPRTARQRREFLRACTALGLTPTLLFTTASQSLAAVREIVVANWGGDATRAMKAAVGVPYERAHGVSVAFDTGPLEGKIKAMVESRRVVWDALDIDAFSAINLGRQGYLRPIDYDSVGRDQLGGTTSEFGVPAYLVSYVIAYDARRFGNDPPRDWRDFWDVRKYPGKRCFWKWMRGSLEAALMADGVPKDQLFPLDVDRAMAKLEEIKPHLILWDSGAESQQMVRSREVAMGSIWHTRAMLLRKESRGAIDFTWNQGVATHDVWAVPKGNPAGDEVWRFLAFVQTVGPQLELLRELGYGPITHAATAAIPVNAHEGSPGSPQNLALQSRVDDEWWASHYEPTLRRFSALFAS